MGDRPGENAVLSEVETALREQWPQVLKNGSEAIWVLGADAQILYYNHNDALVIDIIGRSALDFLVPEEHEGYRAHLRSVLAGGEPVEFRYHSIVGQIWSQRFVPLRSQGEICWVLGFGRQLETDSSEFSDTQLAYNRLRIAVDTTGMGLWRWDARLDGVMLDPRSCAIHGLTPDTDSLKSLDEFLELVHLEDRELVESTWNDPRRREFRDVEYRCLFADGSQRWISCSGSFLDREGSEHAAIIGSCFDISERKLVHEQLLQAQKMQAVGQLTAGISHNFNNILSAILPNLHLAARYLQPEGQKFVRNAQIAAERATDLVAELMLVAGRKEGDSRHALDLYEVTERVIRICRTTFGGWVQMVFEIRDETPAILGNESQIEQVLLNLLLNARDAFEEAAISCPRIDIELETREAAPGERPMVVLRVVDNGPGMSQDTVDRVFEPFFTTKGTGTGLGLATAYAIVNDHGGTINCWSEPERGTHFEVSLPSHDGQVAQRVVPAISAFVGGNERILVVDDDSLVRRVTTAALRDAGYEVIEAAGGPEAITIYEPDCVDLVVLDMAMPELFGDQVLEALRTRDPNIKVLVFTGLTDVRVGRLGEVPVLQKPAGVNDLLQAVRREIDRKSIN